MLRRAAIGGVLAVLMLIGTFPHHAAAQHAANPDRPVVYAWYPSQFGTWNTDSIRWDLITHISFRSVEIRADGTLREPLGAGNDQALRDFVALAHSHGVKVTPLVWVTSRANSDGYLSTAENRERAAQNLLDYVERFNLDGVNIDDEMMRAQNLVASQPNRPLVNDFFRRLNEKFKTADPGYHISYAAPPVISPQDQFGQSWLDIGTITGYVDAIIPMGYELNSPTIGWATNRQPLAGGGKANNTTNRDMVTMVADYLEAMGGQREKLLVGVTLDFGGREWPTQNDQRLSPTTGSMTIRTLTEAEALAELHGRRWDELQASPWYVYQDAFGQLHQGWYSDEESWQMRLEWIREQGLGGIGIWVIDGQNDPAARWDLLEQYIIPEPASLGLLALAGLGLGRWRRCA